MGLKEDPGFFGMSSPQSPQCHPGETATIYEPASQGPGLGARSTRGLITVTVRSRDAHSTPAALVDEGGECRVSRCFRQDHQVGQVSKSTPSPTRRPLNTTPPRWYMGIN